MPELVYHGWSCFTLTTVRGYCEGFNDQTRFDCVRALGERDRPDVV